MADLAHLERPTPDDLAEITSAVASWQRDGDPVQLHPGDIGWNSTFGPEQIARELHVWRRAGELVAIAMGDDDGYIEDSLARMAVSPTVDEDDEVAARVVADLADRRTGVLSGETGQVEVRFGKALRDKLAATGWVAVEPWTPLVRDLTDPVDGVTLAVRTAGPDDADERVAVHRASFESAAFTVERWQEMTRTPAYEHGRCLIGYDQGAAVAAVTVWSAGQGRPGVIEPLGVHRDHVGRGHGRQITLAAAAALREMGASSARVCTPATNLPAVRTYVSAGFLQLPDMTDFERPQSRGSE